MQGNRLIALALRFGLPVTGAPQTGAASSAPAETVQQNATVVASLVSFSSWQAVVQQDLRQFEYQIVRRSTTYLPDLMAACQAPVSCLCPAQK